MNNEYENLDWGEDDFIINFSDEIRDEKKVFVGKNGILQTTGRHNLKEQDFGNLESWYLYCLIETRNSFSYKIGLAITWLPRMIRRIFKR